ncbi:MAG: methyltransferase [Rickettsiales bacterium]|jgi:23S rRNA (uracil1939-C5)-methyltransferase|nr:methyltransferase [Rickettsiales bacterium]
MEIIGINNLGIGYGVVNDKKVFVEKTAVGDIVENNVVVKESKNRQKVACPYYAECGGCNLLHLSDESYYDFKSKLCKCDNIIKIGKCARRRATFNFKNNSFGFFKIKSNEIVEINNCLLLKDEINAIILKLKNFKVKTDVTLFDNGIGVTFHLAQELKRETLDRFLLENKEVIVLSYKIRDNEPTLYLQKYKPIINFNGIDIEVDNNIFLQATKEGQDKIIEIAVENLKDERNILDLYCGIGTYTFPLSNHARIHSIEKDKKMIEILKKNIHGRKITAEDRDLTERPLLKNELSKYDGAVINPPRNGAKTQCEYMADSKIKKIIMISCNPLTFWRDVEILEKGNYKLKHTVGIDQFYGTNHVEIVGALENKFK